MVEGTGWGTVPSVAKGEGVHAGQGGVHKPGGWHWSSLGGGDCGWALNVLKSVCMSKHGLRVDEEGE